MEEALSYAFVIFVFVFLRFVVENFLRDACNIFNLVVCRDLSPIRAVVDLEAWKF